MSRFRRIIRRLALTASCLALAAVASGRADASTAFGDLNNFDVFNDTGTDCHGFEIELEDVHSTDITYTYDYNHYGAPTITEDSSDPAHPRVFVRYAARYDAALNGFSAHTAVPAAPPSPTDGHQCTNPAVNIGCEHFGVGYYGTPTAVRYNWLIEDPAAPGTLIRGPAVNVSTPTWTYYPPAPAQPVAQVQAAILAPPPPEVPVYEFGDAVWVKAIVTTSHNNQAVELKDLVSDDPDDPGDRNWANGEPDEVEVEWHILQTEFNNPDGANNELAGGNEELPDGDEVITRRYEFYKYSGPLDPESNEAKCDNYPQIADPADPSYKAECDPATVTVLGDYIGAQMAGFNVEAVLGLIDHLQDGDLDQPYTDRTVVVGGNTPYVTSITAGVLPDGLQIDSATGVLSGTPTVVGNFAFTVSATDADAAQVSKAYTLRINGEAPVDDCPNDPDKTSPGVCGCGVADTDSDGDGTADCNDQCAADPAKVAPGVCGCGVADVDSDGDGTADCNDQCVNDAAKVAPGVCGCGVADVDSDGDGTADCNDQCVNDAAKVAPGVCGCGVADADSDGDGTADCNDQCANDPAKAAPGACGCGVADSDSNNNGVADCLETARADLSLKLEARGKPARLGRRLAIALEVHNDGPDSATAVTTAVECTGVPFHLVSQAGDCTLTGGTLTCSSGTVRAARNARERLVIVPEATGNLHCVATVASAIVDPNSANNTAALEVPIAQ